MAKPLYLQIKESLMDQITRRQLLPGQQLPTEFELARQFNVSRITSKRALTELENEGYICRRRGKGSFVSSAYARSASDPINKVISMVMPNINTQSWAMAYIKGAMSYLNPRGYFLSIHGVDEQDDRTILAQLIKEGVGGIIYYPDYTTQCIDLLSVITSKKIPIVTIDKAYDGLQISSVVSDNFQGEYMAVRHLAELGHRRIGFVSSSLIGERNSVRERFLGYCQALHDYGLDITQAYILDDYYRLIHRHRDLAEGQASLRLRLEQMLSLHVTALLIENDFEGIMIYRLLRDMGLLIPDDLSLIGFDNSELLMNNQVQMTTINQHFHQIGSEAAALIISQMEDPQRAADQIRLPVELVSGQTTAPPANRAEKVR